MKETAIRNTALFIGLVIMLLICAFTATYAYADASHEVHITYTGIEESVIENYIDPDEYLADGDILTDEDTITDFVIMGYYGDDGLNKSYSIKHIVINGAEFSIPETADEPVKITELDGIDFNEDGSITIHRSDNDLYIEFISGKQGPNNEWLTIPVHMTSDLTIEVAFEKPHTHSLEPVAEVPATCTEPGTEAYWKCSDSSCGKMFSDEAGTTEITAPATIPAKGHNLKKTEAKDASYTVAGNKEYYTCTECGKFFSDADGKAEIAKGSWVIAKLVKKSEPAKASAKKAQPMKVNAKKITVKSKKIKKKAKTVKALTVKNAKGNVSYKISKIKTKKKLAEQAKKKIKLAANGKLTLKKGLKKGTYKVKIKVKAAGTNVYKAGSKTLTVKVVVE